MAFIIDRYNKYDIWDREHARKVFQINDNWYAIKEVELEWGLPQLPMHTMFDCDVKQYQVYDTYEDALKFVIRMKGLN